MTGPNTESGKGRKDRQTDRQRTGGIQMRIILCFDGGISEGKLGEIEMMVSISAKYKFNVPMCIRHARMHVCNVRACVDTGRSWQSVNYRF